MALYLYVLYYSLKICTKLYGTPVNSVSVGRAPATESQGL